MKYLILLLAGVALATPPTIFGPAGMPVEWNITSMTADTLRSDYFSSTDSLYFYTSHYGFYVRQAAAAAGDRDIYALVGIEEDGTPHNLMIWNDGTSSAVITEPLTITGKFETQDDIRLDDLVEFILTPAVIDPETDGTGILNLGLFGDADIINLNGSEFHTASTTYDSTATLAAGVYMCILNQAAGQDTLRLPAAASHTGRMVIIKCVNVNGSLVEGNGAELIDDSNEQALAQWDALQLFCDGTRWLIF